MSADTWRLLAVIFLALAIVLAVAAVMMYRMLAIRDVRDALTGRTAQREIAQLRGERAGSWRGAATTGHSKPIADGGTHETSDIQVRSVTGSGPADGASGTGSSQPATPTVPAGRGSGAGSGDGTRRNASARRSTTHVASEKIREQMTEQIPPVDSPAEPSVVEIPVNMASSAELADDEGETSLMQFRKINKTSDSDADDDESRTILVRGGKKQ